MTIRQLVKRSSFLTKAYRTLVAPRLKQPEPDIFILRNQLFSVSLDIGANVGLYTLELARISKKVLAFEPLSDLFHTLKAITPRHVSLYNVALGSQDCQGTIFVPVEGERKLHAMASIVPKSTTNTIEEPVLVRQGDKLLREEWTDRRNLSIDFVKIDVEGFESSVVQGMLETISVYRPTLLIEIERRHNDDHQGVFRVLLDRGYRSFYTKDGIELLECSPADVDDLQSPENFRTDIEPVFRYFAKGEERSYIYNFWFIHSSRIGEFAGIIGGESNDRVPSVLAAT